MGPLVAMVAGAKSAVHTNFGCLGLGKVDVLTVDDATCMFGGAPKRHRKPFVLGCIFQGWAVTVRLIVK